jgi:hypothetical protein
LGLALRAWTSAGFMGDTHLLRDELAKRVEFREHISMMQKMLMIALLLVASNLAAQPQSRPPAPVGTVTGRVLCADSHLPARLAEVFLVLKQDPPRKQPDVPGAEATKSKDSSRPQITLANTRTLLDGSYTLRNVPPGDYYVVAKLAGYISPVSNVPNKDDLDDLKKLLPGAELVHVVPDRTATVNVVLRRGGTIEGTVRFDDGSPLAGGEINVAATEGVDPFKYGEYALAFLAYGRGIGTTDDQGRYRVTGLPPGKYRVQLVLNDGEHGPPVSGGAPSDLTVYQPGTLKRSQATVFEIKGVENNGDGDVVIALSGWRSVTGSVAAHHDRCEFRPSIVTLIDDGDKDFWRTGTLESDGSFHIIYVPDGNYTLRINGAACAGADPETEKNDSARQFKAVKMGVLVATGDVALDQILLDDPVVEP